MSDYGKTRDELIEELHALRARTAELESANARLTCAQSLCHSYQAYLRTRLDECAAELRESEARLEAESQMRLQVEAERDEQRRILYAILDTTPDHVVFKDLDSVYRLCNESAAAFRGFPVKEIIGKSDSDIYGQEAAEGVQAEDRAIIEAGEARIVECADRCRNDDDMRWFEVIKTPMRDAEGNVVGLLCNARDITERRKLAESQRVLVDELRTALAEVNKLSGLLPICASCKRIRNEAGDWQQMELYIREHSEAEFSHGLCPECAEQTYAQFARGRTDEDKPSKRCVSRAKVKAGAPAVGGSHD